MARGRKIKHLTREEKAKRRKGRFANCIIVFCIGVSTALTAAVVWEYHRLSTVIPSSVLSTLFAFWGGELLIIALRQIFGSDVTKNAAQSKIISDNTEDSI